MIGLILVQVHTGTIPVSASSIGGTELDRMSQSIYARNPTHREIRRKSTTFFILKCFWKIYKQSWHDRATRTQMSSVLHFLWGPNSDRQITKVGRYGKRHYERGKRPTYIGRIEELVCKGEAVTIALNVLRNFSVSQGFGFVAPLSFCKQ